MRRLANLAVIELLALAVCAAAHAQAPICGAAQQKARSLLGEFDAKVSQADRARAETAVGNAGKRGRSRADGFSAFAGGALLQGRIVPAVWAGLQAAALEWTPRHAGNLGVSLSYLSRLDEAALFLDCAQAAAPNLPFVLEAQAMVAYRKKDCAGATARIERARLALPNDVNVRYSAGVIAYRCGDRVKAVSLLRTAADQAPGNDTFAHAVTVAERSAPGAAGAASVPPVVARNLDTCVRLMDDMVARAEDAAREMNRLAQLSGDSRVVDAKQMHDYVDSAKRVLAGQQAAILKIVSAHPSAKISWEPSLERCLMAYLSTVRSYASLVFTSQYPTLRLGADSLGVPAAGLAQKFHGDYVVQDEITAYRANERDARRAEEACINRCGPTASSAAAANACSDRCVQAYCAVVQPRVEQLARTVDANLQAMKRGFPRAAEAMAQAWLAEALVARQQVRRTLQAMDASGWGVAGQALVIKRVQEQYQSDIVSGVLGTVAQRLPQDQALFAGQMQAAPGAVFGVTPAECTARKVPPVNLAQALDQLLAALQAAGSYEGGLQSPDCEIEFGGFKMSCKPLAFDGVKASYGGGPIEVSADLKNERWGLDVSLDRVSGELGGEDTRIDLGGSSAKASDYGVQGKVGVSAWAERHADGKVDVYMQTKATLGVGVGAEGLGSVGCEVFNAKGTVNVRAFAEALVN